VFSKESMRKSSNAAGAKRVQYAALPYRLSGRSRTEVMLVTSRETQRWIPKGWPQRGRAPYDSAAREAFEEAGVVGAVGRRSVGSFPYEKRLRLRCQGTLHDFDEGPGLEVPIEPRVDHLGALAAPQKTEACARIALPIFQIAAVGP
jgi:8-oxo-dGTP pyrophosphatase MutT (NUDIX family)